MGEIPENRTPRQVEQYFSGTGNTAECCGSPVIVVTATIT
jgi:hypothetical protein